MINFEVFTKIFSNNFGHGGDKKTTDHIYSYSAQKFILHAWPNKPPYYVIEVTRNSELWKTFWVMNHELDARILENWNKLSEGQRYRGTQKTIAKYQTAEEFEKVISKLRSDIFN